MVIYVEYAFLENFIFDGVLLTLALLAAKGELKYRRILFSACVGGGFALLYPLLRLPDFLAILLKISVGLLLCLLASGRVASKLEKRKCLWTSVFFFCFTFGFGGALLGANTQRSPISVPFGFCALAIFSLLLIGKLYARKRIFQSILPCKIGKNHAELEAFAFFDSGNLACRNGLPVCFLSPELIFSLFFEKEEGQVCDEMEISTLTGVKRIPLYKGKVGLGDTEKDVYFAPSSNMIGREYQVLLNAALLENCNEMD